MRMDMSRVSHVFFAAQILNRLINILLFFPIFYCSIDMIVILLT